jgi:hypothetical protein
LRVTNGEIPTASIKQSKSFKHKKLMAYRHRPARQRPSHAAVTAVARPRFMKTKTPLPSFIQKGNPQPERTSAAPIYVF